MRRLPPPILVALSVMGIGGIDGFELSYGQDDNQGSDAVFLTVIGSDGHYHPIKSLTEANRWVTN